MIHIGKKMQKILPKLMLGPHPGYGAGGTRPKTAHKWDLDYAIVEGVVFDPRPPGERYFDERAWFHDMEMLILRLFKNRKEPTVLVRGFDTIKVTRSVPKRKVHQTWVKPGSIIIHCKRHYAVQRHGQPGHEISVYRARLPENSPKGKWRK